MATNLGSFNIAPNFLFNQGLYNSQTGGIDQVGARKYLRDAIGPQFDFSDDDLDILISGSDLPNLPESYVTSAPGKVVISDQGSSGSGPIYTPSVLKEIDQATIDLAVEEGIKQGPLEIKDPPGSYGADTYTPPPPPPDQSEDDRKINETVVNGDRGPSQPYFDAQGGRFYGTGGAFVDPIYGNIQYGTGVVPPTLARDAAQYNELFPPYLYGNAPSQTLADLDKIGLGLDFIRNLNVSNDEYQQLLTSWWNQVFTPLYQRRIANTQIVDLESGAAPLVPLSDTGRMRGVGASVSPSTLFSGMDQFANTPSLQLESAPDSLYNQLFSGTGDISNALINSLGDLSLEPEQFNISDLNATQQKLLADLGIINVGSGQFNLGDQTATINKLISDLGNIGVGSGQFDLGNQDATIQKLLADLGKINVGSGQFDLGSPQDIVSTRDDLIDRLGKILLSPENFGIGPNVAQDLRDRLNINVGGGQFTLDPDLATNLLSQLGLIEVGAGTAGTVGPGDVTDPVAGFTLAPETADILRTQLIDAISPLTRDDISVDPLAIGQDIRSDILSGISPLTSEDIGFDPEGEKIADLLSPLTKAFSALPTQFSEGAGYRLGQQIKGLEDRLTGITDFSAGDQFLRPETTAAQGLYDLLYGTTGGSGPSGGISGFQAPASIQQLSDQIGAFGDSPTGIAAQIQNLQRGLGQLDFSQLQDLPDLSALVGDLDLLNELTPGGIDSLTQLTSTLGQFTQEDQNLISLLINFLGEDVVNNLNPNQLKTLVDDLKGAGTEVKTLKDSLSGLRPVEEGAFGPGGERDLIKGLTSDISALQDDVTGLDFNRLAELSTQIGDRETDIGDLESLISGVDFSALGEESDLLNRIDAVRNLIAGDDDSLQADISNLDLSRITGDLDREIGSARTSLGSFQNFINNISYENIKEPENLKGLTDSVDKLNTALGKVNFTKVVEAPSDQLTGLIDDVGALNKELDAIKFDLADPSTKDIDIDGIFDKVSSIRDNLDNIDLDELIAPEGLGDLDATISSLSDNLPGVDTNLSSLRDELGSFTEDDMSRMDSILSLFGPDGIRSLNPEELRELSDTFGLSQRNLFTEFLDPESALGGNISTILEKLNDPEGLFTVNVDAPDIGFGIDEIIQAIQNNVPGTGDTDVNGRRGTGSTGTGTGTGTGSTSPNTFLTTLENALTGKIENQPDITADFLRSDPVTESLLADLKREQSEQGESLLEQLQRFGVVASGEGLQAIPELASAQRREELDVLSDAAQRITGERQEALNQGLDLGRTLTTREQALGTLLGTVGGEQTLDSRQMDLDILAATIAALDPSLDPGTKDPAQKGIALALLELLGMEDDPLLAKLVTALKLRE